MVRRPISGRYITCTLAGEFAVAQNFNLVSCKPEV